MSSDIDNIDKEIAYHTQRAEGRLNEIDPATGQRKYAWPESIRKTSALKVEQLKQSREYQMQANARLAVERAEAKMRNDELQQAARQRDQAVLDRAEQIRVEREATKLANSGADLTLLRGKQ